MKWIPCGTDATFILATGSVTLSSDSDAYKLAPKKTGKQVRLSHCKKNMPSLKVHTNGLISGYQSFFQV